LTAVVGTFSVSSRLNEKSKEYCINALNDEWTQTSLRCLCSFELFHYLCSIPHAGQQQILQCQEHLLMTSLPLSPSPLLPGIQVHASWRVALRAKKTKIQ
jgi:hypothetical protein